MSGDRKMSFPRALMRRIRYGGSADHRAGRYIRAGVIGCTIAWGLSLGYLMVSPKTFTSGFVLVMPGSGEGSSLNLPTLGQATSTSSSPFASPDLSPTENYRRLLLSNRVLKAAAEAAGEAPEAFPTPKVELTDQTKLIGVKITGRSPTQAALRAEALRTAFQTMLDALRKDEIETKESAHRSQLAAYKAAVAEARMKLTDYEAATGLVSIEQYSSIVASVEHLRDALRDADTKLANMRAGVTELSRQIGVTAEQANIAMTLRSDPFFQALLEQLAKQDTEDAVLNSTHGPTALTGNRRFDVLKSRDLSLHDERARLFERLVGQIADTEALAAMRSKLAEQIDTEHARVMTLAPQASHLDDLKRDVQVAEAVFSSALARTDTSKSDYFASHPMVQTLEAPEVPHAPSAPLPVLAVAGGLGATILIIAALVLTWIRTALLQRILKSA
jgi:uncharacterized protein involved in exopolysaccharide biosynthesis